MSGSEETTYLQCLRNLYEHGITGDTPEDIEWCKQMLKEGWHWPPKPTIYDDDHFCLAYAAMENYMSCVVYLVENCRCYVHRRWTKLVLHFANDDIKNYLKQKNAM